MTLHKVQRRLTMDDVVKTRSGLKVRIISVDRASLDSVVALVIRKGEEEIVYTYSYNGEFIYNNEHALDLIIQDRQESTITESESPQIAINDSLTATTVNITNLTSALSSANCLIADLIHALEQSLAANTRI